MAGFAVVMTFLIWGGVLFCMALVSALVLYLTARRNAPDKTAAARRYRAARTLTPFAALLWLPITLCLHTGISNKLAHQSVGFSPDPYITLPNGYEVGSRNTYDGYVQAPGVRADVPWTGPGYVRSLIDLTYIDGRFEGTYLDSRSDMQPQGTDHIRYFVFNTSDRSIRTADSSIGADFIAQQTKVHEDANSYWVFYVAHRHRWPTVIFWAILLGGEAFIVVQFRRTKPPTSNT